MANKPLVAFRKICRNLNSYEYTDEYKRNRKIVIDALKRLQLLENKVCD